ncbi:hypothetical protein [Streptomyces xinghaiensis]|uniref:hypothetical protein n=1 Tax=Streptomyces xinghaiensis TaxID=1038928 RepID=UPI0005951F23|nr:hypothetical protein [Streptomyces xinghaiensis]MZE75524.1 hypothetical protein [Streptomyces sp. SID5475]
MDSVRLAGTIAASGLLCATVVLPAASSAAAASALPAAADPVSATAASAFPAPGPAVSAPAAPGPSVSARAVPAPGPVAVAAEGRPAATDTGGGPNTRQIVVGVCLAGGAVLGMAGLAVHHRRATGPPAVPREREDALRVPEPSPRRGGPPGAGG